MTTQSESAVRVYRAHVVGRKLYFRTVSVVMACHIYNGAMESTNTDRHWFEAGWEQRWYGKVLTIRECYTDQP